MSKSGLNQIAFETDQSVLSQKVAPGGQVVGVEHIQQLCNLSIHNLRKDLVHEEMLRDGTIKIINGDGRLGYLEGGRLSHWWHFPRELRFSGMV